MDFSKVKNLTIPEGVVKQITDASGRVLWSATIKFTINGETYVADRGMTWAEWFASAYNTTGKTADDVQSITANGAAVELSAVIVGGTAYEVGFGPSAVLSENDPATIQAVARSGQASNYWSVGDTIGIAINGKFGELTLNAIYYAFIIGFDHNSSIEGSNTIHFQFGKTSAGIDVAFISSYFNSRLGFRMNTTPTNSGGWNGSYMRKTICPAFLSALPTEWQNVIVACTKYSDNTGGGGLANPVTTTSDKIWLLSEFEVNGTRSYANSAEQNYQKQYDYYKNGNSKDKYQHNNTAAGPCLWWLRSVSTAGPIEFTAMRYYGAKGETKMSYADANYSYGFAPGFMVA